MSGLVESRMGAVAWGHFSHRPVSHPRSSNRTCPIKASGSPTGFTVRHAARPLGAGVRDAADRVLHRQRHRRTVGCHALPLCAVWRGSRARAHRRIGQRYGMPIDTSRGRSSLTSRHQQIADLCLKPLHALLGRLVGPISAPPHLAIAKVASMKLSSSSSTPLSRSSLATSVRT